MSTIEVFYTRNKANEGIKLPLVLPTGERTEHWLQVRGVDSDAFRGANADTQRAALNLGRIENEEERKAATVEAQVRLMASLISGWSFDTPCTPEAVETLLREAPQIMDAVDKVVSNRAIFFAISSASSNALPSSNSDSTGVPQDQQPASEPA